MYYFDFVAMVFLIIVKTFSEPSFHQYPWLLPKRNVKVTYQDRHSGTDAFIPKNIFGGKGEKQDSHLNNDDIRFFLCRFLIADWFSC